MKPNRSVCHDFGFDHEVAGHPIALSFHAVFARRKTADAELSILIGGGLLAVNSVRSDGHVLCWLARGVCDAPSDRAHRYESQVGIPSVFVALEREADSAHGIASAGSGKNVRPCLWDTGYRESAIVRRLRSVFRAGMVGGIFQNHVHTRECRAGDRTGHDTFDGCSLPPGPQCESGDPEEPLHATALRAV
jgi:hypothetical protein